MDGVIVKEGVLDCRDDEENNRREGDRPDKRGKVICKKGVRRTAEPAYNIA